MVTSVKYWDDSYVCVCVDFQFLCTDTSFYKSESDILLLTATIHVLLSSLLQNMSDFHQTSKQKTISTFSPTGHTEIHTQISAFEHDFNCKEHQKVH